MSGKRGDSNNDSSLGELFREVTEAVGDLDSSSISRPVTNVGPEKVEHSSFPTEMSCSQVFDQLIKCYSIGGQIRHYYRYGEVSLCADKRKKLKFCLSTKLQSEPERQKSISTWYKKQLAEQKAQRQSSEEVWTARETPLRRPFREDAASLIGNNSADN